MAVRRKVTCEVRRAVCRADVLAAQRLRYEVFTQEFGDERYADHEERVYVDERDDHSILLIAVDAENALAGTVRLTSRKDGPFIQDGAYPYDRIARDLGLSHEETLERCALMDRLVVSKSHRGGPAFDEMLKDARRLLLSLGISTIVGAVSEKNLLTVRLMRQRDFREVGRGSVAPGGPWVYLANYLG